MVQLQKSSIFSWHLGHHLVNQQHSNMQNSSGPSQQMQERHSQIQQSSEPVSNIRMDNNPKKRMLSQQQHQMVSKIYEFALPWLNMINLNLSSGFTIPF